MKNEKTEIKRILKSVKNYFGKDEKIYIFKCNKCSKLDPVTEFIVNEQIVFFNLLKRKKLLKWNVLTLILLWNNLKFKDFSLFFLS